MSIFEHYTPADVQALIEAYPLAWVCAADGGEASLLPLIGRFDAAGELTELIGHFACHNPLAAAIARNPQARILFSGPDGYVSPTHAGRRDWGPTWNYAQVRIQADISVEPSLTGPALDLLIDRMERDKPEPWTARELGARYEGMATRIVGFRARIREVRAIFKLGQDENLETLQAILANLPAGDLPDWMRRFNRERLAAG